MRAIDDVYNKAALNFKAITENISGHVAFTFDVWSPHIMPRVFGRHIALDLRRIDFEVLCLGFYVLYITVQCLENLGDSKTNHTRK